MQRLASSTEQSIGRALRDGEASSQQVQTAQQQLAGMESSMQQLDAVNVKISGLMKTVDEIAFQSRILALNARIEAARAGEAGASFAVVAEQFGSLAERCASAASETTEFLSESSRSTMEGTHKLQQLAATVQQMSTGAAQVCGAVEELRKGSVDQLRASAEVITAVNNLQQAIPADTEAAERNSQVAHQLQSLAGDLDGHTRQMLAFVGGKKKPAAGPQLVKPEKNAQARRSAGGRVPANTRSARRAC
jgi:methyl-accepting chemotaxis protein